MMIVRQNYILPHFFSPERLLEAPFTKNNTDGCSRRTNDANEKTSEQQKVLGDPDASSEFDGSRFRGGRGGGGRRHHDGENDEEKYDFEFQNSSTGWWST